MAERTKEEVIEIIKKMMVRTVENGCTEAEEISAAAKVQRLLEEHQLSLFDIKTNTLRSAVIKDTYYSTYVDLPDWYAYLYMQLARAFDCHAIISPYWDEELKAKGTKLFFIGVPSDAEVGVYMFLVLHERLYEMGQKEGKALGYKRTGLSNFRSNFIKGAADALRERLKKERDARNNSSVTAMVLCKKEAIERYVTENFGNNLKSRSIRGSGGAGTEEGRRAGATMDLPGALKSAATKAAIDKKPGALS